MKNTEEGGNDVLSQPIGDSIYIVHAISAYLQYISNSNTLQSVQNF